jgi:uncharacterized protein YgbK (DUF1537 family)
MVVLGVIADDFTGATDVANNLVRAGMRVAQTIGVPAPGLAIETGVDALVVSLKSRTVAPEEAVSQSLAALQWLRAQGARQIYFKYCSTFDSTPRGNIGPVTEALMEALGSDFTVAVPAFPDNLRTVYRGHLFVGDVLLHESGMQNHPLTPMTDANVVRVLAAQLVRQRAGLIGWNCVAAGAEAVRARAAQLQAEGVGIAVCDTVGNGDLMVLGQALAGLPLVTGGSGLALGLPGSWGYVPNAGASALPPPAGAQAVVSGSCSLATNRQVRAFVEAGHPVLALDPLRMARGEDVVAQALDWALPLLPKGPVLVYSTADAEAVRAVQGDLGVEAAGALVEQALARIARGLVEQGVRQLIVAGGETSGACVQALGIAQLQVGLQIAPGVPWCHATSDVQGSTPLHLALKSGNFGADDFFLQALARLAP